MTHRLRIPWILPALLAGALASCSPPTETAGPGGSGKPLVHATNYPLLYFAERLAGDFVELRFDAPGDEDPAFWEPEDATIASMQGADLVLLNGADYEKWLQQVTLPGRILVDTSASFAEDFIEEEGAVVHTHGDGEEHSHDGIAFTTWLDFRQAARQVETASEALQRLLPDHRAEIVRREEGLQEDLAGLDEAMQGLAERIGDQAIVASHPVYQYLERRYGLSLRSVHWEPEEVPGEEALAELEAILEEHPAQWMLWEGEPEDESVELLAERGLGSVVFDPCGNRPDAGDWLSVMRENLVRLEALAAAP